MYLSHTVLIQQIKDHVTSLHLARAVRLTKITVSRNEVALNYYRVRRLCFLAFVFVATI